MISIPIRLTLTDDDMTALRELALSEHRDTKSQAAFLLERAIRQEIARRKRKAVK
jgi:hypothetical protein